MGSHCKNGGLDCSGVPGYGYCCSRCKSDDYEFTRKRNDEIYRENRELEEENERLKEEIKKLKASK